MKPVAPREEADGRQVGVTRAAKSEVHLTVFREIAGNCRDLIETAYRISPYLGPRLRVVIQFPDAVDVVHPSNDVY